MLCSCMLISFRVKKSLFLRVFALNVELFVGRLLFKGTLVVNPVNLFGISSSFNLIFNLYG